MDPLEQLKHEEAGLDLYWAGLPGDGVPGYPRFFARDGLNSALLFNNPEMLRDQLLFCAGHQGTKEDPLTGEEPGKIFHEFPGHPLSAFSAEFQGDLKEGESSLTTEFNACDTTGFFLEAHAAYKNLTGDDSLIRSHITNIRKAAEYILRHLEKGLFIESPAFSGASRFALKVSYWKDSQLSSRPGGSPVYPICYFLAHAQNIKALRSAGKILNTNEYDGAVGDMVSSLDRLWDEKNGCFYIAVDGMGPIRGITSDSLHALNYLEPGDLADEKISSIVASSAVLETAAGYRAMSPELAATVEDKYHADTVWPFEQALISEGANKFKLENVVEVSRRVFSHLDSDPEILVIGENGSVTKGGCDPQLLTIAAKNYFSRTLLQMPTQPEELTPA